MLRYHNFPGGEEGKHLSYFAGRSLEDLHLVCKKDAITVSTGKKQLYSERRSWSYRVLENCRCKRRIKTMLIDEELPAQNEGKDREEKVISFQVRKALEEASIVRQVPPFCTFTAVIVTLHKIRR